MNNPEQDAVRRPNAPPYSLILCAGGILVNLTGTWAASALRLPLELDSAGTILAAVLGGYLPGIAVGFFSGLLNGFFQPMAAYYGVLNVLTAVCAAFFARRGWFRKISTTLASVIPFALIGGGFGALLSWPLNGFDFGTRASAPLTRFFYENSALEKFPSQLAADLLTDFAGKALAVLIVALILRLLPESMRSRFRLEGWRQTPLSGDAMETAERNAGQGMSLRTKIVLLIAAALLTVAIAAAGISSVLYHRSTIEEHIRLGRGVAGLAGSIIEPDRVDEYLERGEDAAGYRETEQLLYSVRDSSPDIEYVYVYRILEDGCHVVFDLDTEEVEGSDPGDVIPFDESFAPYLPALLAGQSIDPVISNDSFGWLLTVYQPVYDRDGVCSCYAAADISMNQLTANECSFITRQISLFFSFFILILAMGLWLAEYNIILPVNSMALAAGAFAYDSETARADSIGRIRNLCIRTGDEIENLYHAFSKTTEDTLRYVADIQAKTETISKMQNGLILVLADMVESRDQCTGDHVRKTAAYAKIIMEQMRRDGSYREALTDEFIADVVNSAPLHDVGKIHIPDAVLNKPGRLTREEFRQMKDHTTAGSEIIDKAIAIVPGGSSYLNEARNLAAYHHERWDGKGYPSGLAGEQIPLSARIMAVADVFDALVSRRSYKKSFPFEEAMKIIREGSGTHFDPKVAQAFLHAEEEVRRVADTFENASQ